MSPLLQALANAFERAAEWCSTEAARIEADRKAHLSVVPDEQPVEQPVAEPVAEPETVTPDDEAAIMERSRIEAQSVSEAIAESEKQL